MRDNIYWTILKRVLGLFVLVCSVYVFSLLFGWDGIAFAGSFIAGIILLVIGLFLLGAERC